MALLLTAGLGLAVLGGIGGLAAGGLALAASEYPWGYYPYYSPYSNPYYQPYSSMMSPMMSPMMGSGFYPSYSMPWPQPSMFGYW